MASGIPPEVRRFVARHIDSVSLLDVLLLLRATPDRAWAPSEVSRALVTGDVAAASQLRQLHREGLARADGERYRYAPSPDDEGTIDELAESYARRRHTVIGLIYGATERSATTFADAFRVRRTEP